MDLIYCIFNWVFLSVFSLLSNWCVSWYSKVQHKFKQQSCILLIVYLFLLQIPTNGAKHWIKEKCCKKVEKALNIAHFGTTDKYLI